MSTEKRFSFGKNWAYFLKGLNEERIVEAEKSLKKKEVGYLLELDEYVTNLSPDTINIGLEELLKIFHWKNTRPLYKEENRLRKYSLYDILIHELKIKFFLDKHSDKSYDNMNYGVPYLPKQVRDNLLDLINR